MDTSRVEAVAAVDVHVERHRPEAVGRVEVAVPREVLEPAPEALALVLEQERAQVVDVGALARGSAPRAGPARTRLSTSSSFQP